MKILFINLPYHGHIVPTVGLVQELIRQGCQVTYLLPFGWEDNIKDSGAVFRGYENHRQLAEQMKNCYAAADKIAPEYDGIVYEQFFFLGKHLAEKHHKPVARIFTAPATNRALMDAFLMAKGPMSIFRHQWLTRAFTKDIAKDIPLKTDNWLDEIIRNPPELNLVYTLREFQPYGEDFPQPQFHFLGPSVYPRKEPEFPFSKGKRPVVYISLGTVLKGEKAFFQTCIEAFRGEAVDVILSVGRKFRAEKLRNVPENIHIYSHVPQLAVLKMADVFVTHGGMNSVSEAMVTGTPMVVIPMVSDQPVNARQVEALGLGRQLSCKTFTKQNLKENVFAAMEDASIQKNLAGVQNLIRQAPGNRGGASLILEQIKEKAEWKST